MRVLLISVFCLVAAGCSTSQTAPGGKPTKVEMVSDGSLAAPERADLLEQNRAYLIGPFDKLTIDVFGIEELSKQEVQTDATGRISFPLAGVVDAAGRTPAEVEDIIEGRLRGRFVRNPQVTVNLKETLSQVITVDGQVREPGLYPVIGKMTLMRAIATAKGASEFAKLDDVVIFRSVKGKRMAGLYNMKAIRRGLYEDPELYANDIVVVGDSSARRLFKDFLQILPALTTPIVVALQ